MDNESLILVVDLEATCWQDKIISPGRPQTVDEMEIIEFGCVVTQINGTVIDSRSFMVRPVKHPILSTFCTELTTITQQVIDAAPPYLEAVKQIDEWLSPYSLIAWGSWGNYDRKQLDAESRRYGRTPVFGHLPHLNLKQLWRKGRANARRGGLQNALKFHALPFDGTEHRGIDDAKNIAKLLPFINKSEQDICILELNVLATAVFQSSEQASKWLVTPQKALGGETPFNLASSDAGTKEVRDLLGRILHGVFS